MTKPMPKPIQWLSTLPNPHSRDTGYDAGQRGWRLHAVLASNEQTFESIKRQPALCGLVPAHGWGMDLYIERKCARCVRAVEKMPTKIEHSKYAPPRPQKPAMWWKTCAAVFVSCPSCAKSIFVDDKRIEVDGRVRLKCLNHFCDGFDASVILIGWEEADEGPW